MASRVLRAPVTLFPPAYDRANAKTSRPSTAHRPGDKPDFSYVELSPAGSDSQAGGRRPRA